MTNQTSDRPQMKEITDAILQTLNEVVDPVPHSRIIDRLSSWTGSKLKLKTGFHLKPAGNHFLTATLEPEGPHAVFCSKPYKVCVAYWCIPNQEIDTWGFRVSIKFEYTDKTCDEKKIGTVFIDETGKLIKEQK